MGMALALRTLSDRSIDRILAAPPLIWRIILRDDPEALSPLVEEPKPRGFLARLFGAPKGRPLPHIELDPGEVVEADLDKAWHGVHFLLSGSAAEGSAPLDFLVVGGHEVGDEDVGYGPGRVFRAAEVAAIHRALRGLSESDLQRRFDPARMTKLGIYPAVWDREEEREDNEAFLLDAFGELKQFIQSAVERKVGILITIE